MQIKIKVFLLFIAIFLSCNKSNSNKIADELTSGGKKFWYFVEDAPILNSSGVCFNKDGSYFSYTRNNVLRKKTIPYNKRTIRRELNTPIWKLTNDSTLVYGGNRYKIVYINNDIFVLSSMEIREKIVLMKDDDQTTMPVKDTTKSNFGDL